MDDNKIGFAGDIDVQKCTITSSNGVELDILHMVASINLYEDMYSPFLTAEVVVIDSIGLANKLPFRGEELITLTVKDGSGAGIVNQNFFCYKLKDRISLKENVYSYSLMLISCEAIDDISIKISKAYSGQPSEIVTNLVSREGLQSPKLVLAEDTKTPIQFIANYWSPIQAIKFLCDRSVSKSSKSPSYVFYETKVGFRFMSLNFLATQSSQHTFTYTTRVDNDVKHSLERIRELFVDESFDYIKRVKAGTYGSRLLLVNPVAKSYMYRNYDFTKANKDFARLNESPISTDNVTRRVNSVFDVRTAPTSTFKDMAFEGTLEWFQQRKTELALKDSQKIQIEVPGRMNISVGDISDVFIYSEVPRDSSSADTDFTKLLDKVLSGRYMITAINHKINKKEHLMMLELSKDSMMKTSTANQ